MPSVALISNCTIYPQTPSSLETLKLSVSDLPMLSCHYIQKGLLFPLPCHPFDSLLLFLKQALSKTLTYFPPLSGRLTTDSDGFVHVNCNDAGVNFIHARAAHLSLHHILSPVGFPDCNKDFFSMNGAVSYEGHFKPIMTVQVTELEDGVFIGCTVNHAVTDGTSFWNFFNSFAQLCREGEISISKKPDFQRNFFEKSLAVIKFPDGALKATFDVDDPLRQRMFHFSREAILNLKSKVNSTSDQPEQKNFEMMGKLKNDTWLKSKMDPTMEISSLQSLCAQLWRSITRARKLPAGKQTTFRMAVNCRSRLKPEISPYYFGNAIQSIPTIALSGDILSRDLHWCASLLHENVVAYDDAAVRKVVDTWEKNPRVFPLGNFDGGIVTMGSSPRFPMYDNDFGWGRPMAVRSGMANKFDGKCSAFPGREGDGSVELEVCLAPETMEGMENDEEFMQHVSDICWD